MPVLPTPTTPYYGGGQVANPANVIRTVGVPSSKLTEDLVGTMAVDNAAAIIYGLASKSGGVDTWVELGGGSGSITSVLGTTAQITATTVGNVVTLSLPSLITAPGSLATTTTLTAGTSITATLGNITATNGSFVASTAGTGIVFNPGTVTGTSTGTLNARVGQIQITSPSIPAGSSFVFTLVNSSITSSSTQVLYSLTGGTTGAALSLQGYANTAGDSVITIQNGTGATTNTATLKLNFIVLN
jgi:hypothetical protein